MKNNGKWMSSLMLAVFLSAVCIMPVMAEADDQQAAMTSYSDDELKSFIIANVNIFQLQQQANAQIQTLETDEQRVELIQATNQQMGEVLQQIGLTPEKYNAMGQAIQSDDQLQEKINSIAADLSQQQP